MKVRVRFFAGLGETLGREVEELELAPDITTVAGLLVLLRSRGGTWADALAEGKPIRAALNQDMADPAARLSPGDEVAFFPPVTGG